MPLGGGGDYRKVGNGTTTGALHFISVLKPHHSSNRSRQGDGKRRKASGRSCLRAFVMACTTAERTSAGICATAASSLYTEASARCLSARSRRSAVRATTLDGFPGEMDNMRIVPSLPGGNVAPATQHGFTGYLCQLLVFWTTKVARQKTALRSCGAHGLVEGAFRCTTDKIGKYNQAACGAASSAGCKAKWRTSTGSRT